MGTSCRGSTEHQKSSLALNGTSKSIYGLLEPWYVKLLPGLGSVHSLTPVVQIWDLFEGGRLFRAVKDGHLNDEQHLAEMVSLLGPPPSKFLNLNDNCRRYWDSDGRCHL